MVSKLRILDFEKAWAAGLFDGEGTAYAYKQTSGVFITKLSLAQSSRFVLDRFCKAVGVGKVYGPYGPYKTQTKPYWLWQTTTNLAARRATQQLRPFLSPIKIRQIREAARYEQ